MKVSQLFTKTKKETPANEVSKNAQLLIRAGFIHKEFAGVYAYMPLGLRVLENIKTIVREEMNSVGGLEVMMTVLQPKDIWEKTDRWDDEKVDNWFKTKLVNGTELGVGLTHEEPIVDALSDYVNSHKDFPVCVYQIQNKFRNELRAKSGLLRGREFVMKDMYTMAISQEQHEDLYEKIVSAYLRVYERLGLGSITYRTYASGGIFTERFSDEFQTISEVGEDIVYVDEKKKIAINKEIYNDQTLAKLNLDNRDLKEMRGVEVGNTFHLETKYTDALGVYFNNEKGLKQSIIMGCYGIGISRLMGVLAEHFSDDKGLNWPESVAPFKVYLISIGDDQEVLNRCDKLYKEFSEKHIDVLYDDRDVSAGEKFSDSDLLGIPYRIVVSIKTTKEGSAEVKKRGQDKIELIPLNEVVNNIYNQK